MIVNGASGYKGSRLLWNVLSFFCSSIGTYKYVIQRMRVICDIVDSACLCRRGDLKQRPLINCGLFVWPLFSAPRCCTMMPFVIQSKGWRGMRQLHVRSYRQRLPRGWGQRTSSPPPGMWVSNGRDLIFFYVWCVTCYYSGAYKCELWCCRCGCTCVPSRGWLYVPGVLVVRTCTSIYYIYIYPRSFFPVFVFLEQHRFEYYLRRFFLLRPPCVHRLCRGRCCYLYYDNYYCTFGYSLRW